MGGRGVVGDGAIADGPNVFGAVDDKVFVYGEAAAGVFLRGDLAHEVFDDGAQGVASSPDKEAVGEAFGFFGAVWASVFSFDGFVGDLFYHGFCADGDGFFFERRFGVVDELFGEHGKDIGQSFNESDVEVVRDFRHPFLEVLLEEVLELASEFNTCGTSPNDYHVKEALSFFGRLVFEACGFYAVHDTLPDFLSIADLF